VKFVQSLKPEFAGLVGSVHTVPEYTAGSGFMVLVVADGDEADRCIEDGGGGVEVCEADGEIGRPPDERACFGVGSEEYVSDGAGERVAEAGPATGEPAGPKRTTSCLSWRSG
jgi:hypothetical protein